MDTREASLYPVLILLFISMGMIILYFFHAIYRQQRKYRSLYADKVKIEINTLEAERKRIAAVLHDEVGANLFAVKNILQSVEGLSDGDLRLQNEGIALINSCMVKIRFTTSSLMPDSFLIKGIAVAVEEYIAGLFCSEPAIEFTHESVPCLDEIRSIQVYRIILEIIQNTIKHAGAGTLRIHLEADRGLLVIKTADDGCGYEIPEAEAKALGLGLQILRSRICMLNGELHVRTAKGAGTAYIIQVPLSL
jgi:two-component system, NarL family, sensor kinase